MVGSPGAGFKKPRISLIRRSVIGVKTSLPASSVHVAGVPLSNPYSSRNSAGITTWPFVLMTVRKLRMNYFTASYLEVRYTDIVLPNPKLGQQRYRLATF